MRPAVRAGVTTRELNDVGAVVMRAMGARSAPMIVYDFPAETCISVNDEIVHGIPSTRRLVEGDLVKLDVTVEKHGYMADAAITVPVGRVSAKAKALTETAERAFVAGVRAARAGGRVFDIGAAVEEVVSRRRFHIVRSLTGHGIGRTIHEPPDVPNFFRPDASEPLTEGLVLTIEPLIAMGSGQALDGEDGWTVLTADGSYAAHYEHTIVIGRGAAEIVTAA
jgi:methionyl aminopeptidase